MAKVGIIGIGQPNSVGYELCKELFRTYIPKEENKIDEIVLFNRSFDKSEALLESINHSVSEESSLKEIYGDGTYRLEDDSLKLVFEKKGVMIPAMRTLEGIVAMVKDEEDVMVICFEATKNWLEWLRNAPVTERQNIRKYLLWSNLPGILKIGEAIRKFEERSGSHKAHKLVVTNPPCYLTYALWVSCGCKEENASRFSGYAAIDGKRLHEILKEIIGIIMPEFEIERVISGKTINPISNCFTAGEHGPNSIVLWNFIRIGGVPFEDIRWEDYAEREMLKKEIKERTNKEFLNDLEKYGGKTTEKVVPSLAETVWSILTGNCSRIFTNGMFVKIGEDYRVLLWPLVYRNGRAEAVLNAGLSEIESKALPTISDLEQCLGEDEQRQFNDVLKRMEDLYREVIWCISDENTLEKKVEESKRIFNSRYILLQNFCQKFLDSLLEICPRQDYLYIECENLLYGITYAKEDVLQFISDIKKLENHPEFEYIGMFISALINKIAKENELYEIDLRDISKRINYLGFRNKKAYLKIFGKLGHFTGAECEGGIIEIIDEDILKRWDELKRKSFEKRGWKYSWEDLLKEKDYSVLDQTGKGQIDGSIIVRGVERDFGAASQRGGFHGALFMRDYSGYEKTGGELKVECTHDCFCFSMKGGHAEAYYVCGRLCKNMEKGTVMVHIIRHESCLPPETRKEAHVVVKQILSKK